MEARTAELTMEREKTVSELKEVIASLRCELANERDSFESTMANRQAEYEQSLRAEKERLEALLVVSRCETAKLTEQLESVIQEKAKLAVVASHSLMQGEKLKKDAEDTLKRERAEMERKFHSEVTKIKRDLEIINKLTLEVKVFEIEEIKLETRKKLEEAETKRLDAVRCLEQLRVKQNVGVND